MGIGICHCCQKLTDSLRICSKCTESFITKSGNEYHLDTGTNGCRVHPSLLKRFCNDCFLDMKTGHQYEKTLLLDKLSLQSVANHPNFLFYQSSKLAQEKIFSDIRYILHPLLNKPVIYEEISFHRDIYTARYNKIFKQILSDEFDRSLRLPSDVDREQLKVAIDFAKTNYNPKFSNHHHKIDDKPIVYPLFFAFQCSMLLMLSVALTLGVLLLIQFLKSQLFIEILVLLGCLLLLCFLIMVFGFGVFKELDDWKKSHPRTALLCAILCLLLYWLYGDRIQKRFAVFEENRQKRRAALVRNVKNIVLHVFSFIYNHFPRRL